MPLFPSPEKLAIDNQPDSEVTVLGSVRAGNTRRRWREDFAGSALSSAWEVVQQGAGQTIGVANSELVVGAGIIVNAQTIIRSINTFKIPFRVFAVLKLSQRIANQEFYLEIIDASGLHSAAWQFDQATPNNAKIFATNAGSSSGNTYYTTPSVSTAIYSIFEIDLGTEEINFYPRNVDNVAGKSTGQTRSRQIPDPSLDYYLQIRCKNLATAPASNTSFIFDSIVVQETEEFTAEISGGRGGGNINESIPVAITTGSVSVQNAGGSSLLVADVQTFATEIALPMSANSTQTTAGKDGLNRNVGRGWVFTNVPGTLYIEQSFDNTVWRVYKQVDVPGDAVFVKEFEFKIVGRYYRFRYVNGVTAQTVMQLINTLFGIGA